MMTPYATAMLLVDVTRVDAAIRDMSGATRYIAMPPLLLLHIDVIEMLVSGESVTLAGDGDADCYAIDGIQRR